MKLSTRSALATLAFGAILHAQTPAAPPAPAPAGPTLDQTVQFLNERYAMAKFDSKNLPAKIVYSHKGCMLREEYTMLSPEGVPGGTNIIELDLTQPDPLSVSVEDVGSLNFIVHLKHSTASVTQPNGKKFSLEYAMHARNDKTEAERLAKAMIHALVLCQKDKPAPLF